MRGVALPARTLSAKQTGGHPGPRTPSLRASLLGIPAGRARCARGFPPRRAGGFLRLCRSRRLAQQGPVATLPPRFAGPPLVRGSASGPVRSPPPALPPGGWGWGCPCSSVWPAPCGPSAAPAAAGGGSRWSLVWLWGCASWLLCLVFLVLFRSFPWPCVLRVAGSRPGRVPLWAFRSAVPVARCRVLWRLFVSHRWRLRLGLLFRGVGACQCVPAFAPCVRSRVVSWSRCRFARACRRAALACGACWPLVLSLAVASLALFPAAAVAVVGFSGSRRLPPPFAPVVSGVVASVLSGGRSVAVGCAAGADAFVRSAAPSASVFSASAFGSGRSAFARRSIALVRSVAAGGPGSGLVVFPAAPCPSGLLHSASASRCFCGLGSGSWASAAFAAGLGLPVVVFPCGFSGLPLWWGAWKPAARAGVWARGWRLAL